MDDSLHDLPKDIATSLRRIAAALEGRPSSPRPIREPKLDGPGPTPGRNPASAGLTNDSNHDPRLGSGDGGASTERADILRAFLADRGITIKFGPPRDEADEVLDLLAFFIGSRFQYVREFYHRLKSTMNDGKPFTMNLKDAPQEVVSNTCQLATELHRIAFLEEYRYRKSPHYLLYARPSRLPRALNFLSGGWLERYAVAQAFEAARSCNPSASCSYLKNPQIVLPNGDDFELDVLFEVEGEIYWLELKTGGYQRHIAKYSKMSRLLELERDRCYMVLTNIPRGSESSLSALFHMTVVRVEDLGSVLARAMARHLPSPEID